MGKGLCTEGYLSMSINPILKNGEDIERWFFLCSKYGGWQGVGEKLISKSTPLEIMEKLGLKDQEWIEEKFHSRVNPFDRSATEIGKTPDTKQPPTTSSFSAFNTANKGAFLSPSPMLWPKVTTSRVEPEITDARAGKLWEWLKKKVGEEAAYAALKGVVETSKRKPYPLNAIRYLKLEPPPWSL